MKNNKNELDYLILALIVMGMVISIMMSIFLEYKSYKNKEFIASLIEDGYSYNGDISCGRTVCPTYKKGGTVYFVVEGKKTLYGGR